MHRLMALCALGAVSAAFSAPGLLGESSKPIAPQAQSVYTALESDRQVSERTVLLAAPLRLAHADYVFVSTDGSYAPVTPSTAGDVHVEIDGRRVTNESVTDWRVTPNPWVPVRHSFNVIGGARLGAGTHVVTLVAKPLAGSFSVSASSNLSVFVHPARRVAVEQLRREKGPYSFTTRGPSPSQPHDAVVSVRMQPRLPAVALGSASLRAATVDTSCWGDPMVSIYGNGRHPGNDLSLWAVQELGSNELEAPVFTHARVHASR